MILIDYSVKTEADRLYQTAFKQILNGFFTKNNWYVINYGESFQMNDPVVLMPNINVKKILGDHIKPEYDDIYYKNGEDSIVKSTIKELKLTNTFIDIDKKTLSKLKNEYNEILSPVVEKTLLIFDQLKRFEFSIIISPTYFSTYGSFNLFDIDRDRKNIEIVLRPRMDVPSETVVELFISSITRSLINSEHVSWRETEAISDFFAEHVFNQNNSLSTIDLVSKHNPIMFNKSIKYLMSNGLPIGKPLSYDENTNKISLIAHDITDMLAPYEFRFLRSLIQNNSYTTSYDQLSEDLYNSKADLQFSLWGINKTAQRVRDKLELVGLPRETLKNVKGEGFKLMV